MDELGLYVLEDEGADAQGTEHSGGAGGVEFVEGLAEAVVVQIVDGDTAAEEQLHVGTTEAFVHAVEGPLAHEHAQDEGEDALTGGEFGPQRIPGTGIVDDAYQLELIAQGTNEGSGVCHVSLHA